MTARDAPKDSNNQDSLSSDRGTTTTIGGSSATVLNVPRDGPAYDGFEVDPHVVRLRPSSSLSSSLSEEDEDEYGLVLVAGWPRELGSASSDGYVSFASAVRDCFPDDDADDDSALYLYPPEYLHVTVATFHRFTVPLAEDRRETTTDVWRRIAIDAWDELRADDENDASSSSSLRLRVSSAQIGRWAGVLLWEETTGRLERLRTILRRRIDETVAAAAASGDASAAAPSLSETAVPSIAHSTFLRFAATPRTDAARAQELFRTTVTPHLCSRFFPAELDLSEIRLVCERRPYMHVPDDDRHVMATLSSGAR